MRIIILISLTLSISSCISSSNNKDSSTKLFKQRLNDKTSMVTMDTESTAGYLFLGGGGIKDPTIIARFVEVAGGAESRLVIIPTASADNHQAQPAAFKNLKRFLARFDVTNVDVIHTRDRAEASSESFLRPLRRATGVWFWGGRSARLVEAYVGTEFVNELQRLYARGGVIGGTSAGTSIQSELLLRADPENTDLISPASGFGFLGGIALDVHFLARNRIFTMQKFLKEQTQMRGIGVDEDTAIIVHNGSFEVIGNSYVTVYDIEGRDDPYTFLSQGDHFDLTAWKILGNCTAWAAGCIDIK